LVRFRLPACLLAFALAAGCKAQPAPPADATLNRNIEVMVRTRYQLPPDYTVSIGERKASPTPGYDSLPITISKSGHNSTIDFLISKDNSKLARMETMNMADYPALHIDVANRPVRGNASAPVTVVNFDDLECPFCARMHSTLFPATIERYKDKVRFIYKDDPLTEIHPWAMHASIDANCVAAQSGTVYWQYVDYLHSHGQEITGTDRDVVKSNAALDRIARDLAAVGRLDTPKLNACLEKKDEAAIRKSMDEATALNIEGTPAVFVNGERIDGALPREQVWMVIDRALKAAGVEPPPAEAPAPAQPQPGGGR
jgi:protein-disulfide isomerase